MFKRLWNNKMAKMVETDMRQYMGYLAGLTDQEMGNVLALALGIMKHSEDEGLILDIREALSTGGTGAEAAVVAVGQAIKGLQKDGALMAAASYTPWFHTLRAYTYPETRGLAREIWDHLRRGDKHLNNEDLAPYKDEDLRQYLDWAIG